MDRSSLLENGYTVSIPFGDNEKYDLVVDTGNELLRVQCKTGWREDDVLRFKTASQTTANGSETMVAYDGAIDAFAVRCRDSGRLYWIPIKDAGKRSTYLRLAPPKIDHPSVKLAESYRFDERLPTPDSCGHNS